MTLDDDKRAWAAQRLRALTETPDLSSLSALAAPPTTQEGRRSHTSMTLGRGGCVAMVGALVYRFPQLTPLLAEHLGDNQGEVLPHLLMSDVTRWLVSQVTTGDAAVVEEVMRWISEAFERGHPAVRELIAVSCIEDLPAPGEPGSELRMMLTPSMRQIDPWNQLAGD